MSNESAAAIRQERRDWAAQHREMYLRSGGAQGHVMDISEARPAATGSPPTACSG
jgi:hypothetical protein